MSITTTQILRLLFIASILALLIAFLAEYTLDMQPCGLCIYQRFVFGVVLLVILLNTYVLDVSLDVIFAVLCMLFLINVALAGYQVLLEYDWVHESIFCKPSRSLAKVQTIEELRQNLMTENVKDCTKPKYLLFGLSMAFYNALFSCSLGSLSAWGICLARRHR